MSGTEHYDAIVVGAGHNGLVAATYLAKAGKRVLVLEASDRVGGMAATRDIGGGLNVPVAPAIGTLSRQVVRDLALERHGLRYGPAALATLAFGAGGERLHLRPDNPAANAASLARFSPRDAERLPDFQARLDRLARGLQPLLGRPPPRLKLDDWRERLSLARLGWSVRRMGRADMRDLLRILPMNAADLADEVFESDPMQGVLCFDAVLGNMFGPRSPNTVFTLLQARAAAVAAKSPTPAVTATVMPALEAAARAAGVEIRLEAPVAGIPVVDGRTTGVRTRAGATFDAGLVLSSAHPKRTLLDLVGVAALDSDFVRQLRHVRSNGATARVDMVLGAMPELDLDGGDPEATRLVLAPSIAALERSFDTAKYGGLPERPPLQAFMSTTDDGRCVLSATVQYAPSRLAEENWAALAPELERRAVAALDEHVPGLAGKVERVASLTPAQIENDWGAPGGHWHHIETGIDQSHLMRPVPGWAQYTTPIEGLLLCGAGTHPGGGVTGRPGANAARRAIALSKRGRV